jgi:hypothetical protein
VRAQRLDDALAFGVRRPQMDGLGDERLPVQWLRDERLRVLVAPGFVSTWMAHGE